METLVLGGRTYVKASKAARELGYTSDYVGQLCRNKHIDAQLVGRSWYVDQEQLRSHKVEKKRMSRIKAREQIKKSISEHALKVGGKTAGTHSVRSIRYEEDTKDLIPTIRKLAIDSEATQKTVHQKATKSVAEPNFEIENEGEKVVMSGKLAVFEVGEEIENDPHTVVMKAKINRKQPTKSTVRRAEEDLISELELAEDEEVVVPVSSIEQKSTSHNRFVERLVEQEVVADEYYEPEYESDEVFLSEKDQENDSDSDETQVNNSSSLGFVMMVGVFLPILLVVMSLIIDRGWVYTSDVEGDESQLRTDYEINMSPSTELIRSISNF